MKKEKVISINLPDGAEYRRVEVTDGGISIIYAEETAIDTSVVSKTASKALPKPRPLIGGTKVYQKEGTPYWYCKIKGSRDEFMYLYFGDLTNKDVLYAANGKKYKFVTERQKRFKTDVMRALDNMPKEGFRWIPIYEPSMDTNGNLQYVSGANVLSNLNSYTWEGIFHNYSPENGSKMSSITTYFLLLLRLLKDGFATVEQLADNSNEIGHYCDSENAKDGFEKTGERQLGGLYGIAGNTYKIVRNSESSSGISLVGGYYDVYGYKFPLGDVVCDNSPKDTKYYGIGLLELTK